MSRPHRPFATRGRRAPFSQVGDWVVCSGIHGIAIAVYWALEAMTWRDTDHETGEATAREADPSRETLAEMFGFSRPQSVDPYIKMLVELGAVDVIAEPGYTNRYVVHQTPPDDYDGPQTMGQWHRRRAARKDAEAAQREAARTAAVSSTSVKEPQVSAPAADPDPENPQVSQGYAPQRTSPKRRYAPQRTGGVRSSAQGVCATAHTKEETSPDPGKRPPTPEVETPREGPPAAAVTGSAPASGTPTLEPRCAHGLTSCRPCGTNPRARAAAARQAELDTTRDCSMCDQTGARWDPADHMPVSPYTRCDHRTPHDHVMAEINARETGDLRTPALT